MLLISIVLLFLVRSVENQEQARNDDFPSMWEQAPGRLEDYKIRDNIVIINPWNYRERLGLGKILISATAKYFSKLGADNSGNLLWSLVVLTGWEWRTGRLTCGLEHEDPLHICSRSWWAGINFFILATSFLAAAHTGILGDLAYQIEFSPPEANSADFCYSFRHCSAVTPKAMENWRIFFEHIKSNPICDATVSPLFSPEVDKAWKLFWDAHLAWHESNERVNYKLQNAEGAEAQFSKDFINAVDFIAATHFSADLKETNAFIANFPGCKLKDRNSPLEMTSDGFTEKQKTLMSFFNLLNTMNNPEGLLLHQWQKAMCTEEGRAKGRNVIRNMVEKPLKFILDTVGNLIALGQQDCPVS
ncbi:protein LEG1 homolog [Rhinatrema bivittatum]|uniref:protein LEG1 homolog n=1 Tax=Rhinatrema bivittatum TaxID=194408 RepID=UPI00112A8C49|nr:protein LEG1 homolog [Rhinatrema bivittatum]